MATKAIQVDFDEAAAPATPAAGDVRLYAKTDGLLYSKDDAGTETLVSGGAGGGGGADLTVVYKTADESVTNTTLQDDDHLVFAIGASELWAVKYFLFVQNAAATADFKFGLTVPASATGIQAIHAIGTNQTALPETSVNFQGIAIGTALAGGVAAVGVVGISPIILMAYIENSTNAGNVTLQWAQNSTDGSNATVVKKGSWLEAIQLA